MRRIVKYTAIDPYYSDTVQTYIGMDSDEIDAIQYETERSMSAEHTNLGMIYRSEVICDETDSFKGNHRV